MTSVKPRPANGPGANGLRGGIKQYVPKTITGHWLEEFGGPAGYKRGFTTAEYETEGQHQQTGAKFRPLKEFGPELPDESIGRPPSSPFKYDPKPGDENPWATNSQLMGRSILVRDKKKEEETALKPHISREALEKYRRTWTTDPEYQRHIRFSTETRLSSANIGAKFTVRSVRPLPGTPKPMELLRNQLVEKYGIFAFTMVRCLIGTEGEMSSADFRRAISSLNCSLKPYEVNQIMAYIAPGDEVPVEKFLYVLKGSVLGYQNSFSERVFKLIQSSSSSNSNEQVVTWDDVLACVNSAQHPEVVEAMQEYAGPLYIQDPARVTFAEISSMLQDMFAVSPDTFEESMREVWQGL